MELGAEAFCCLGLLMTWLHLLMPFRFFGTMLIATFRMLVNDVVKWASVYIFVLLGFSFAIYVLVISYQIQEEVAEMDSEIQSVWDSILVSFKITMGTARAPSETAALEVMNVGFSIFNSLLLLNLLIAMMSDTYGNGLTGFRMWWMIHAHLVLRYEKQNVKMHAWTLYFRNKAWPLYRTGIDPKSTEPEPSTRAFCIQALEHSEECDGVAASLKDVSEEECDREAVSLKDVMQELQKLQELMRESQHPKSPVSHCYSATQASSSLLIDTLPLAPEVGTA
jgi:hypothetical protein